METEERITHTAYVVNVTRLSAWDEGTGLVKLTVTDNVQGRHPYLAIPDIETQPEPAWIESLPPKLYYYCTPEQYIYYTDYFRDHGCTVVDDHFVRKPDVYDISWRPTDPNWFNTFISLISHGESVTNDICYYPVELSSSSPPTLVPADTHHIHRFSDAYYNFNNVTRIRIFNGSSLVEVDPSTFTAEQPLHMIHHMFDHIYLDALDSSKPISYRGITYSLSSR
jgi:hypothetical protein